MALVSVIVINYNGLADLAPCLESIASQDYPGIELLLIDNCSTDGSRELLERFASDRASRERFHGGSPYFIPSARNTGFSPALNLGISRSTGTYAMPLNTDIVLGASFISELVRVLERQPDAGSASGKLLRFPAEDPDSVIDSAGHLIFRNRLAENRGEGQPGRSSCNEPCEVFGTCGAAAMYKREMLEDIAVRGEVFDEDFFAFWEDLDVDWRARIRGWRCLYEPAALGWHRRGGAGYRKSLLVERHNLKNRLLMMIKCDNPQLFLANLPGILFTGILKDGAVLLRCPKALLSIVDVVRLAPAMLRKRRVIQRGRRTPVREVDRWFYPFHYRRWLRRNLFGRGEMIRGSNEAIR